METPSGNADQTRILDLLKLDYEAARAVVDKLDNHLFAVRNWAVTTIGAIAALSATVDKPPVLLVGLVPTFLFGVLELMYKGFHDDAISHSRYLERQIHRVAILGTMPEADYEFGIGGHIHRPRLHRMAWTLLNRREISTFYGGMVLILVVGVVIFSRIS
jgi:uncharacterized membrane protein